MKFVLETKVGLFVILAIVIITAMSIIFGKIDFKKDKNYFNSEFIINDASGLQPSAPVLFRGVKVGYLKNIRFAGNDLIATLSIKNDYQIPDNVIFSIRQEGFIGQKYIELVMNRDIPATAYLTNGNRYQGNQTDVSMDDVMATIDKVADRVDTLVKALNDIVDKDDTKQALHDTIQNIRSISENINKLIAENNGKFNDIIDNTKKLTAMIDKLLVTNEKNVNKSIDNIAEITHKLNETVDNINSSKGTLGMLINDNKTKEQIKSVVSKVNNMVSRVDNYKLFVSFGADWLINDNNGKGYIKLRLYTRPDTFYQFGVSNSPRSTSTTTDTNVVVNPGSGLPPVSYNYTSTEYKTGKIGFSLQYGHIFKKYVGVRIGLFDNTLGGALDIYPLKNDNLTLSLEAYDFGNFNKGFHVFTKAEIRWNFYKWFFVEAGVEDLFNFEKRIYTVGGGVRFSDDDLKYFAGTAASAGAVK